MPTETFRGVVGRVRCALTRTTDLPLTDGQLLTRFAADRDDDAFTILVRRHGPMVFGVCRRAIGDLHLAEDACQAVFLTLARRAGDVSPPERVGPWLYGVACRTARAAMIAARRRAHREQPVGTLPDHPGPGPDADRWDVGPVLDEEIRRLPAKYRDLLVSCELQGRQRRETARELGVPEGTVASRLSTARRLLRERLVRRGVGLSVAALLGAARDAAAVVPWRRLAAAARAGRSAPGEVPVRVAALVVGGYRVMGVSQLRAVAACLTAAVTGALVLSGFAGQAREPGFPVPPPPVAKPAAGRPAPKPAGPGKLLLWRQGHLCALAPDGTGEVRVSKDRKQFMPDSCGARWSPDGTRVAYLVSPPAGGPGEDRPRGRVYVRGVDEKEPGTDLGVTGDWLVWSPDGSQLVVVRAEDETVTHQLIDLKTKTAAPLELPDGFVFWLTDWSRDGKHFLGAGLTAKEQKAKDPNGRLYLIPRAGGAPILLTPAGQPVIGPAVLSPDGRKVLHEANDPERVGVKDQTQAGPLGLFVLDVLTRKSVRLAGQPIDARVISYCWSPDGKRVAYVWHKESDVPNDPQQGKRTEYNLVVADADGENAKAVVTETADGYGLILLGGVDWR